MQIIPAIDIRNGKCVRLFQGDYNQETIYDSNPIKMAKKWKEQGAKILHIVDLDGARYGKPMIIDLVKELNKQIKLPIQVGGGIRDLVSIYRYIDTGVMRIILGTTALEDRTLFKKAINKYREKIAVSLDIKSKTLMKRGWLEKSNYQLFPVIKQLESLGLKTLIFTDIVRDGTLTEPNYKYIELIKEKTKMKLIVTGGISSINQIKQLKKMKIDGIIIGKALYEGKINLKEVIKYAG